MNKGQPLDDKAKQALTDEVTTAVQDCLAKPYSSKDDALDAIIADLEALKGGPAMGGLGTDNEGPVDMKDLGEGGEGEQ